ncbi:MAG TPA: hypothetical protein VHV83_19660 [Armatimonadota bacterium]|nr:hypothetical protein [Armatimonadota bacterium]
MLRYAWVGLLMVWLAGSAIAGEVTATLLFDKPTYLLGEDIQVRYRMTNNGHDIIRFGSDVGRLCWRSSRWIITATGAGGHAVPDPYMPHTSFFTASIRRGPSVLEPGETYEYTLPLMRYCDFPGPGVYTVRIYHTAEWGDIGDSSRYKDVQPTPVAEGTLQLRMPTQEEAVSIVRQMQKDHQSDIPGNTMPFADFTTLRYPVYLPILAPLAAKGDPWAMVELAAIVTPKATRTLLRLAQSDLRPVAWTARYFLLQRLPVQGDSNLSVRAPSCLPIFGPTSMARMQKVLDEDALRALLSSSTPLLDWAPIWRDLTTRSWETSLHPAVYNLALRLLVKKEIDEQIWGAKLLQHIGDARDLPRVLGMMDQLLTKLPSDGQPLDMPRQQLCRALQVTADTLVQTGAKLPTPAKSLAAKLVLLDEVHCNIRYRPQGWQQVAAELLRHRLLYVRLSAAYDLPAPLDPQLMTPVLEFVRTHEPETDKAFCRIAMDTPQPEFASALQEILTSAQDEWLVVWASQAAPACGIPNDRMLEIFTARIDEPSMSHRMLELLVSDTVETRGLGYRGGVTDPPEEFARLKARWTAFINEHRTALRAGTRYPIGSEAVTADLLPCWLSLEQKDGTSWPKRDN